MLDNPIIEIKKINNTECLNFVFNGELTENNAAFAIDKWKLLLNKSNTKIQHIWNCKGMTGYEPMARSHWQRAIKELKGKIDKIWLVSDSALIIAGARILSVFTSLDIKTVSTEESIVV